MTYYEINLSFLLFNAASWMSHRSFVKGIEIAKNIKSTSIFTEQLVGKVTKLNNLSLLRDKNKLNNLALCAVEK